MRIECGSIDASPHTAPKVDLPSRAEAQCESVLRDAATWVGSFRSANTGDTANGVEVRVESGLLEPEQRPRLSHPGRSFPHVRIGTDACAHQIRELRITVGLPPTSGRRAARHAVRLQFPERCGHRCIGQRVGIRADHAAAQDQQGQTHRSAAALDVWRFLLAGLECRRSLGIEVVELHRFRPVQAKQESRATCVVCRLRSMRLAKMRRSDRRTLRKHPRNNR